MRVTKNSLETSIKWLNALLERPESMFNEHGKTNPGHLLLDKNDHGYQMEEIVSDGGAARAWTGRMNGSEMALFISGVKNGISLRNAQLTEKVLRKSLDKVGLTITGQELYNS